jgi:hypothetical protein
LRGLAASQAELRVFGYGVRAGFELLERMLEFFILPEFQFLILILFYRSFDIICREEGMSEILILWSRERGSTSRWFPT